MSAVMGRFPELRIRLRVIFRLVVRLPLRPRYYPPNLFGLLQLWWVKAYTAAGQAGGCLHTMAVLQAYQADLLKEMDEGDDIKNDDIAELRRATDLSLRATKETD